MAVIKDTLDNFNNDNPYIPSDTLAVGQSNTGYVGKVGPGMWNDLDDVFTTSGSITKAMDLDPADMDSNDQIVINWSNALITDLGTKPSFNSCLQNLGAKQSFVSPLYSSWPLTNTSTVTLQGLTPKAGITSLIAFFSRTI